MYNWISALADLQTRGEPCVLVTIIEELGSTPRNAGSKIVISARQTFDTIGGGHLEYKAMEIARQVGADALAHLGQNRGRKVKQRLAGKAACFTGLARVAEANSRQRRVGDDEAIERMYETLGACGARLSVRTSDTSSRVRGTTCPPTSGGASTRSA